MGIVVEDGSIVANSNSYISRADYIAYAASIGVTIADAVAADEELIKAASFIDQHEPNLQGTRTNRDNPMAFPRWRVLVNGWSWNSDEIPRQVILAQQAYALDVHNGVDLWNKAANPNLIASEKEVSGAVSIKYAISGNDQKMTNTSTGDALLATLLKRSGLYSVELVRA